MTEHEGKMFRSADGSLRCRACGLFPDKCMCGNEPRVLTMLGILRMETTDGHLFRHSAFGVCKFCGRDAKDHFSQAKAEGR